MPKKTSLTPPSTPGVKPIDPARVNTIVGMAERLSPFEPSDDQIRVRSALWALLREQPSLDAQTLSVAQIRDLLPCDSAGLDSWWREPAFRKWFLAGGEDWRGDVEEIFVLTLRAMRRQLYSGEVAPKDLANFLKLSAEIARRVPGKGAAEPAKAAADEAKSPAELRAAIEQWALDQGWTPPKGWAPTTLDLPPAAAPNDDDSTEEA